MPDISTYALCSQAEAQQWLRLSSPTDDETDVLILIINHVTKRFEDLCGRQFIARAVEERLNGTGNDHIFARQYPIVSVDALQSMDYDDSVYNEYDVSKVITSPSGRIQLIDQDAFPRGSLNIKLTYQPGWDTNPPDDVKVAALQWVAELWETWSKKREPIQSVSLSGQTTVFFNEPIPRKVLAVIEDYTLPCFATGA